MSIKIVDNFLNYNEFLKIKEFMLSDQIRWIFSNYVSEESETDPNFYFVHHFYKDYNFCSNFFSILNPILWLLNPKAIIRIKGNMYPKDNLNYLHGYHIDFPFSHLGAIFYVNSNNGKTFFNNSHEVFSVDSIENRIVFFDPSIPHSSSSHTDQKVRVNINFNYF